MRAQALGTVPVTMEISVRRTSYRHRLSTKQDFLAPGPSWRLSFSGSRLGPPLHPCPHLPAFHSLWLQKALGQSLECKHELQPRSHYQAIFHEPGDSGRGDLAARTPQCLKEYSPSEDSPLTCPQGLGREPVWTVLRGWHAASFIPGSMCLTSSKGSVFIHPLLKALALKGRTEDWRLCDLDSPSSVSAL